MDDIMVCVKQVPNTMNIKLDPETHTLIREGVASIMNPFDEFALDIALDCKDRYGVKVGVLTMGPIQAKEILRYCIEKGVDEAYLLTDSRLAGSDTLVTAKALYTVIVKTSYKNIFCGQESIDSSTGHIGPSLAELLGLPQVVYVTEIIDLKGGWMKVRCKLEKVSQIVKVKLPAVFTFRKTSRKLRPKQTKAYKSKLKVFGLDKVTLDENEVGIKGSPTRVIDIVIDESALNYIKMDENLSAYERIKYIMNGGVEKKENRIMLKGSSKNTIQILLEKLGLDYSNIKNKG